VPFVWISNQASNNGVLFGSYVVTKGNIKNTTAQNGQLIFNPDPNSNRPVAGSGAANTSYELDIANPNLKYPKIWRTNLAVDQRLPGGIIATIEGAYSKDINAIYHENLVVSDGYVTLPGVEGQIQYNKSNITPTGTGGVSATNPVITSLYYMNNTSKGYSYFVTGQLQKALPTVYMQTCIYTQRFKRR